MSAAPSPLGRAASRAGRGSPAGHRALRAGRGDDSHLRGATTSTRGWRRPRRPRRPSTSVHRRPPRRQETTTHACRDDTHVRLHHATFQGRRPSPTRPSPTPRASVGRRTGESISTSSSGPARSTEQACQTLLDKAIPKFGDMQSYFIIQRSDNFDGLEPGWFIVIEAYGNPPDQYNLEFGRQRLPRPLCEVGHREDLGPHPGLRGHVAGQSRALGAGYTVNSGSFLGTATFLSVTYCGRPSL